MTPTRNNPDLEEARQLFRKEGLPFPPIPDDMTASVRRIGKWLYGTRADEPLLFEIDTFINEAVLGQAPDYVLFGHSGRSTNSWAMHFYLVRGPLYLFIQVGWGGAYFDEESNSRASAFMTRLYVDAETLLESVEQAQQQHKLQPQDRLVLMVSALYGAQWTWLKGEQGQHNVSPDWHKSELDTLIPLVIAALDSAPSIKPTTPSQSPDRMKLPLEQFLFADELDELPELKNELDRVGELDASNIELLWLILQEWEEKQAIANMLMYPDVMPAEARFSYITQALQDTETPYLALAAIVGIEKLSRGEFTKTQRKTLINLILARMESSIHSENPVIAERATIALPHLLDPEELLRFQRWLNYPNEIIRHNVIVGLLDLIGPKQTKHLIESAIDLGATTAPVRQWLRTIVDELENLLLIEPVDATRLLVSNLGAPILPYIPNLKEWREQWNDTPEH